MKHWGIKYRITMMTLAMNILVIVTLIIVALYFFNIMGDSRAWEYNTTLNEGFDRKIKEQVESVVSILENNNKKAMSGEMSLEAAKFTAADTIRNLKYGEDGYFFADTGEGINVVNLGKDSEGKSRYDAMDLKGNYYIRDLIANGKKPGGGYTNYYFARADGVIPLPKRSYSQYFAPFDWNVGTGNYIDDITEIVGKTETEIANSTMFSMLVMLGAAVVMLMISALLSFLFSKKIADPIYRLKTAMISVSGGNLDVERIMAQKDRLGLFGVLVTEFIKLVGTIKSMIDDLDQLNREVEVNGNIDFRIDTGKFEGSFREMVIGVNDAVNGLTKNMSDLLTVMSEIGNGNFNVKTEPLPGKKAILSQSADLITSKLSELYTIIESIAKSVTDGELDVKADAGRFQGGWSLLLRGFNSLVNAVSEPLIEIENSLSEMKKGNFNCRMTGDYKGAFDSVKNAVNMTGATTLSYIDEISHVLRSIAKGDLTVTINHEYVGSYKPIKNAMRTILDSLNHTMGGIDAAAAQVHSGSEQISLGLSRLAVGSAKQLGAIQSLLASVDVIDEKTKQNAQNTENAENFARKSTLQAQEGNAAMQSLMLSMDNIKQSSANISSIIKTIEDIAFQTNLLALNAAVEAARAGEHGKGFAVVADEVRGLASRSQKSVNDTTSIIEDSIHSVDAGINTANETAAMLKTIVADADQFSGSISRIAEMSNEQTEAVSRINAEVNEISGVIQENTATSEEFASAAQELSSQAETLKNLVAFFILRDNKDFGLDSYGAV